MALPVPFSTPLLSSKSVPCWNARFTCLAKTPMMQMPSLIDAVPDYSLRRAIHQNNLGAHLEDVFMTRSHLLMDHLPKAEGERLDGGIVPMQEFEQLGRRFRHTTLTEYIE